MLYESDPATGTTTAQTWDATGKLLHEQASNLEGRLRTFDGEWQGTASDEYKRMVTDLVGGLRKVADTSLQMRDLTYDAVDSLVAARAAMPAAVDVPVVPPATLALATTPLPIDATTSPAAAAQMQSDQAKAVSAVQAQQAAISAANSAHAQAVAVMRTLADSYVVAQDRFPPTPGGATPTLNGTGPGTGVGPDTAHRWCERQRRAGAAVGPDPEPEPDARRADRPGPAGPGLQFAVRRHVHGRPGGGRGGRRRQVRGRLGPHRRADRLGPDRDRRADRGRRPLGRHHPDHREADAGGEPERLKDDQNKAATADAAGVLGSRVPGRQARRQVRRRWRLDRRGRRARRGRRGPVRRSRPRPTPRTASPPRRPWRRPTTSPGARSAPAARRRPRPAGAG